MIQPEAVTDLDMAFPARGIELKPGIDEVPDDFDQTDAYALLFIAIFTGRAGDLQLIPYEGVDPEAAYRHLRVVMGCYGFKHEDKERLWCWLASQWFGAFRYEHSGFMVEHNWPVQ